MLCEYEPLETRIRKLILEKSDVTCASGLQEVAYGNLPTDFVRASIAPGRAFGTLPEFDLEFWKRLLVERAVKSIRGNYFLTRSSSPSSVDV